jgi:hypothetical protein
MECLENTEGLSEEDIERLVLFFSLILATEPLSRRLPNKVRTTAESMFFRQKNAEPIAIVEAEAILQNRPGENLDSIGILCKDIEGCTRPFGYFQYVAQMSSRPATTRLTC